MIDCHCHILPGIDDGSKTMEQSLAMARRAVESGITHTAATPHHLNGVYMNSRSSILDAVAQLSRALEAEGIPLKIIPGSELHLVPELVNQVELGEAMTYANLGKAVLVEFPKHSIPTGAEQILENLIYRDITPIVAHPERNSELRRNTNKVGDWVEMGCKLQLTAQSCSGEFGGQMQELCRQWCLQGWVHLIASDAHRVEGRAPDMRAGVREVSSWMGEQAATELSEGNPRRLLSGRDIKQVEPPANARQRGKKRSFFSAFRRRA